MGADAPLEIDRALADGITSRGVTLSDGLQNALRSAMNILREAVAQFGPKTLATAFNGGKDATVVLHLVRAALATASHTSPGGSPNVLCMYLTEENAFEEVDKFVHETVNRYDISAVEQEGGFKEGIRTFVEKRGVKAFVMGTRRSDPHACDLQPFSPSTPGWPTFMRINPIIDWEYKHVWEFLRVFQVPYCSLYDEGYTSIGNKTNTKPNPELVAGSIVSPAWNLEDPQSERAGRSPSKSS